MTLLDYAILFFLALLGMVLQMLLKARSIQDKAKKANLIFSFREYFLDDWLSHAVSITTIVMFLFFVTEFINFSAIVADYLKVGFAFVGYSSADIASRIFSVVNKRVNSAIDYKTTQADEANGTLDKPTPTK